MRTNPDKQTKRSEVSLSHEGFFVLRTPLLPLDEFFDWSNTVVTGVDGGMQEEPLQAAHQCLRTWLARRSECPIFLEALSLASVSLFRSLIVWRQQPDTEQGRKAELSLVRYFSRMTSRPTPFGLFAGCSLGLIGESLSLCLSVRSEYVRKTRLDHAVLQSFVERLLRDRSLREQLRFRRNDTLVIGADRWRHAETRLTKAEHSSFHLVATERSPYLDRVIARAYTDTPFPKLAEAVTESSPGVSVQDAADFIHLMIDNQLLSCELAVPVTGEDPVLQLENRLRELGRETESQLLHSLSASVANVDRSGLGVPIADYSALNAQASKLIEPTELRNPWQVDLWKPTKEASLPADLVAEIITGVSVLAQLQRARRSSPLARFKESFRSRYEGQRIPILLALDPECGLGFEEQKGMGEEATALVGDLTIRKPDSPPQVSFSELDRKLLQLMLQARDRKTSVLELDQEFVDSFPKSESIPDAVAVLGALFTESPASAQCDGAAPLRFRIDSVMGPSAASLLGRFCHIDRTLRESVEQLANKEQSLRPNELLVEIAHRLHGRTGNIALRPVLRSHELPVLGRSGAPSEQQISLDELSLFLRGDELWLYCERLGKRIRPRLSNAHNYSHPRNLHIYRFLCALHAEESSAGLSFDWGALSSIDFLPRVTLGRLVLSPARWRVSPEQLKSFGNPLEPTDRRRIFDGMQGLRRQHELPRHVLLAEGDNTLLCDLDNVLSVLALVDYAKNRPQILFEEFLGAHAPQPVCGPEGRFVSEVVIPLLQTTPHAASVTPFAPTLRTAQMPTYALGTEWLYCKFYAGIATVDRILLHQLAPLLSSFQQADVARWFFVRYGDPDWHLRLRLHGDPQQLYTEVLPTLQALVQRLLSDGQLVRFQIDTYEPEWERYGGLEGMKWSEEIFCADSQAILSTLPLFIGEGRSRLRWQAALASMAALLVDFFPSADARLAVAAAAYESYSREFSVSPEVSWRLAARFRSERSGLERLLHMVEQSETEGPLFLALRERSHKLAPVVKQLRQAESTGALQVSLSELVQSHLHMSCNRILRSVARAQELVLYDFLVRLYRSQIARRNAAEPKPLNSEPADRALVAM